LGVWIRYFKRSEVWATDKWRALLGFAKSERIDLDNFLQKLHPEDRGMVSRTLAMAPERDGHYETEYRVMLPDGGLRWIGSRGRVEFDGHDKPVLARGVSMDITARKLAEAEVSRQRAELTHVARVSTMGELAASVAHELSQPLGAILRNAEAAELFLQHPSPDMEEVRAILTDIRKDDQRAGAVIDRMRSMLKRRGVEHGPVDLNVLVGEVISLVRFDADSRKVRLEFEPTSSLPPVHGDRVQLQQVMLNLLLNGMDAMKDLTPDRRRVTVRLRVAGAQVEVAVSDTGHGIPEDKLPRVFEPFFTTKPNGLGIGLAISRRIIEAHGGRLWAENNAAGGATFAFSLPVAGGGGSK
jgi:C4-dicarboxylate-specific signal transduction histidine kinase